MSNNGQLGTKAMGNMLWRLAERCGVQGMDYVVTIILARILSPEAYGTVALLTVVIAILNVFVNSGLGSALIQKKDADELDFSTVFLFNMGMSIVIYLCLFFVSPWIAAFYGDPNLTPLMRVLGLTIIVSGMRNIQQAYVSRNLMFKKFFYATLWGTSISAVVAIIMAYQGYGVWTLIAQQLINSIIGTCTLYLIVPWRPQLSFSWLRFRGLYSYGWKMLVSGLLDTAYNNLRQLIIGKMYSKNDLAYYNQGRQVPFLIIAAINSSIDSVLLPIMSKEQDDRTRVKAMTRRAIRTSTYIMAPLMIGLAVCAEPLVRLLLTDKWMDCVPFMRIFCISFLFYPIHTANLNAVKAMGRSDWFLKLEIVKKIVGLAIILITMWHGVLAITYGLIVSTLLSTMINAYPNKKLLDYSWFEQMKDILPHIGLAVLMGIPVLLISYLPLPMLAILGLQIVFGAIIYLALSVILKLEVFYYLFDVLKGFAGKRK